MLPPLVPLLWLRERRRSRAFCVASAVRGVDLLVWAARYWLIFSLMGRPIPLTAAAALAVVSQIAMLIPIVGNGLGLREWAIGLTIGLLPTGVAAAPGGGAAQGIAADLVNRAAELVVAVPVGLYASASIARRLRQGVRVSPRENADVLLSPADPPDHHRRTE